MSELNLEADAQGAPGGPDAQQFLTFILNGEEYGMDILRVQEIKGWTESTHVPNTPTYVVGVINLRGEVIPILDLRSRFSMDSVEPGPTTVVVVTRVETGGKSQNIGVVVDAVSDVYTISNSDVKKPPCLGDASTGSLVSGVATVDDKMVILLEVDLLLDASVSMAMTAAGVS